MLLAVDLGLRTGLALFGRDGKLLWYRSRNFGTPERLRRAVHGLLADLPDLEWLIVEGGGPLAEIWQHEAVKRHVRIMRIGAEDWRSRFFNPCQHRTARTAKRCAGDLARRVIDWSGAARPTSLRHDAAEAILIGLWGAQQLRWLRYPSAVLQR